MVRVLCPGIADGERFGRRIEIGQLDTCDYVVSTSVLVSDITYDDQRDWVAVATGCVAHIIQAPEAIYAKQSADGGLKVAVIERQGANHLIRIDRPKGSTN